MQRWVKIIKAPQMDLLKLLSLVMRLGVINLLLIQRHNSLKIFMEICYSFAALQGMLLFSRGMVLKQKQKENRT